MAINLLVMVDEATDDDVDCVTYDTGPPHSYFVAAPLLDGFSTGDDSSWDSAGTTMSTGEDSVEYTVTENAGIQYFRVSGFVTGEGNSITARMLKNGVNIHEMTMVADSLFDMGLDKWVGDKLEPPGGSSDAVTVAPGDTIKFVCVSSTAEFFEAYMATVLDAVSTSTHFSIGVAWNEL